MPMGFKGVAEAPSGRPQGTLESHLGAPGGHQERPRDALGMPWGTTETSPGTPRVPEESPEGSWE